MTTTEMVKVYVNQLCAEIGCTPESIYSKENNSWFFTRGSATIEVFMSSYETVVKTVRTFIRCFSPVYALPADNEKKVQLYQEALQNNANFMGVKLGIMPGKGFMYAIAERDIEGMDYTEFKTLVSDLGYWADQLDNILHERFGATASLN
ncbi:MAG TPA: YbjN domain-containing protein [Panacibacter sp.]|nr:YbjN domain-containing protein [Panacibacter sp.]